MKRDGELGGPCWSGAWKERWGEDSRVTLRRGTCGRHQNVQDWRMDVRFWRTGWDPVSLYLVLFRNLRPGEPRQGAREDPGSWGEAPRTWWWDEGWGGKWK